MADRPLTSSQAAILARLQAHPKHGLLSGHMISGRRAAWAKPRLHALLRRGLVERHATNVERWYATSAGRDLDLTGEAAHA